MKEEDDGSESITTWFATENSVMGSPDIFPTKEQFKRNVKRTKSMDPEFNRLTLVYAGWESPATAFRWYISHYNHENDVLFGFVKLGEDETSEWGPIDREELDMLYHRMYRTMRIIYPMVNTFLNGPVRADKLPMSDVICRHMPMTQPCNKQDCRQRGIHQCGKCKEVFYCSKECQRENWDEHKSKCCSVPNT
jgi:hypothetical protein